MFWDVLGHFGIFGKIWDVLRRFWMFWTLLDVVGGCGRLWEVVGPFEMFLGRLGRLGRFSNVLIFYFSTFLIF